MFLSNYILKNVKQNVKQNEKQNLKQSVKQNEKIREVLYLMDEMVRYSAEDIQENKVIALLSYLGILFLVPLLAKKDSPFAQFHAKQGLVLFVVFILFIIMCAIIIVLAWMPYIGWIFGTIFMVIPPLGGLFFLIMPILGIVNCVNGNANKMPLIGQFSEKVNI